MSSLLEMDGDQEKDWKRKYEDVNHNGVASIYWPEVLNILKYLETKEEYEKCQFLWTYYRETIGKNVKSNNGKRKI